MSTSTVTALKSANARRGAEVLLEVLKSEGVEYLFGNPGTTELSLMDALLRAPALKYILALQEASAVAMADGYAQAARRPAFLNLHTYGGLGHGMGNLLNASVSRTPLVVTAGQQDSRHTLTDPLLFGDLVKIAERCNQLGANSRSDLEKQLGEQSSIVAGLPPSAVLT